MPTTRRPRFNIRRRTCRLALTSTWFSSLLGLILAPGGIVAVGVLEYIENQIEAAFIASWRDIIDDPKFPTPGLCLRVVMSDEADGSFTINIVV